MPLPSGPTRFLPFSQLFEAGYMTTRYQDYFHASYVSVELVKGDGIFFNPSIFHAAGENTTNHFYRNAHLIQINSNFGKPSEFVNSCWDLLVEEYRKNGYNAQV
ncbi:uncharacterized protein Z518_02111 [Rhinocladiella mackenziei CBS 650.93]|uniref:Phytanoyl-CoA dioxygenase n=1 Tax=Rhinocladiella mackenziei CBS 650.93 TaxID=1442369 RepID=A0A0D2HAG3_9EURO|nr:uncharacterized protein Z518_02111 [Rhinocladiella mackenziei CBS 650.93]KIX07458.1 hypothetical protein Z518_02111 [Rhinocladiella mackenziei CBS 650.93]